MNAKTKSVAKYITILLPMVVLFGANSPVFAKVATLVPLHPVTIKNNTKTPIGYYNTIIPANSSINTSVRGLPIILGNGLVKCGGTLGNAGATCTITSISTYGCSCVAGQPLSSG